MARMRFGERFDSLLTAVRVYLLSERQRRQVPPEVQWVRQNLSALLVEARKGKKE